ncbi:MULTISPECIES: phosphotyrosine protein phosphatase [unclassified Leeuwenhoekiella]|uniref:phosphotyrosine protein phosphatase n=1 Tax=unclassified Leeuwenhoekiella TaxID=2615029 RepID=UPI000C58CA12|nr:MULTISPECIES: phosphotyrosine protein phosphatase [unclassified Leeuwenhoekiella]MAW94499.1 phosphotyrosine protein phosphatase [Leeuwenhoekiella sp.]MAW96995.1 phosphotyrosine protein phosphatase [Leeuwenhoekiella sp.]MBA80726.1 phosphotyrosine protein phosphatase [Leeuwenhoekiella sp.]|tara:strand:+ start:7777 stop:8103 length:327 start_codon:yes stop_codon:yes gene_type:complete
MNHLFICSANKQRSKTAEDYFAARYPDLEILSAGTNLRLCRQESTTPLSEDLLQWADHIWVMETRHRDHIKKSFGSTYYSKITVLHIQDHYPYYDPELIRLLEEKVKF